MATCDTSLSERASFLINALYELAKLRSSGNDWKSDRRSLENDLRFDKVSVMNAPNPS